MRKRDTMEYYQGRALQEREKARASVNASIARIHMELAEHYERVVEAEQAATTTASERLGAK